MAKLAKEKIFSKSLSQPDAIPKRGIERATAMMESGLLFRYGEQSSEDLEVSRLEQEFADYLGVRYVCGVNSGGCALFLALKAVGVKAGEKVLLNAFTLAPVPGAIHHAGAEPVLVDIDEDLLIDLDDLRAKARSSGAKVLLLSHMRGHIADMHQVKTVCHELGLTLIEDCAHTMGAKWNEQPSGTFGEIGCYSTQTFKHINSGEGGLVATNDEDLAAKIILHSGSYMLYAQHGARPSLDVFERWKGVTPNYSMRMSALVAAVLRPQIPLLDERVRRWNERYGWLADGLSLLPNLKLPERPPEEQFVGSSLQFSVIGQSAEKLNAFQKACDNRGLHLKWFGRHSALGFTSTHQHWSYIEPHKLEHTDGIMNGLFDMRVPLHLNKEDCQLITDIVSEGLEQIS